MLKMGLKQSVKWLPHQYQKKAIKFLLSHPAGALFLDPGLGKTAITLSCLAQLKKKGQLGKVLLVAPLRVCHSVWPTEIAKWLDFKGLTYTILHGDKKEKNLEKDVDIYIINPEGLDWLLDAQVIKFNARSGAKRTKVEVNMKRWKALGFDHLVIDELSKFKATNTNRFKMLKLILPTFQTRWGLTGTPAPNGLLDLFGQMYVIDLGQSLGQYITQYREKFFSLGHNGFDWNIREGSEIEIARRIAKSVLRMAAEDYLDLPDRINNVIKVELPAKIRPIYDELQDDMITNIENKTIVAATAGVASMKCRQVANGGIFLDPQIIPMVGVQSTKREWVDLHKAKVEALEGLVEELQGEPLLVAYEFKHDLSRLQEHFGDKVPVIGSGTKAKDTGKLISAWNDGQVPLMFIQPQAGAHGLDGLQHVGAHVCFHSNIWDFELYDQLIKRILRQGNKSKRVFVHHIVAEDTVDEIICAAMVEKNATQQTLFGNLKKLERRGFN